MLQNIMDLFEGLTQDDIDWALDNSEKVILSDGDVLIKEGEQLNDLYFVLMGSLNVQRSPLPNVTIEAIGIGKIIGELELSLQPNQTAAATVIASDYCELLKISFEKLLEKCEKDPIFAHKLCEGLLKLLAKRLRNANSVFTDAAKDILEQNLSLLPVWKNIRSCIQEIKDLAAQIEQHLLDNKPISNSTEAEQFIILFVKLANLLDQKIGHSSSVDNQNKDKIGYMVEKELLPYILLSKTMKQAYTKPNGYAGDFKTINGIANRENSQRKDIGQLIDEGFYDLPPAKSVRNRRQLIANEIINLIDKNEGEGLKVTVLSAGPALEIFDVFDQIKDPKQLTVTLIDSDTRALAHVQDKRDELGLKSRIRLVSESPVLLALGRSKVDVKNQHLVYSMGLTDYFRDRSFHHLLNFCYDILTPGGKVIIGNYHTETATQTFLKYVLKWDLIYRTEDDFNRLCSKSKFAKPCDRIVFDNEGIDMFGECTKD